MAKLTFTRERCKACKICLEVCPRRILELEPDLNRQGYHPARLIPGKEGECTGCALCARMCPDVVIEVEK